MPNWRALYRQVFTPLAKKRLRKGLLIFAIAILSMMVLSFIFRNTLFNYYFQRYVKHFNTVYHAELTVKQAKIKGLSSLEVDGIILKPAIGDTLLTIDSVFATVSIWKMISGRIALNNFVLTNTKLTFVKHDSLTNYMFLLDRKTGKKQSADTTPVKNYASRMKGIMDAVFDKIPDDLLIRNFTIRSDYNGHDLFFHIDTFNIIDHHFRSFLHIKENLEESNWVAEGALNKHDHIARFTLYSTDNQMITIPFIKFKWNAEVAFDTINFSVEEQKSSNSLVTVAGNVAIKGLDVDHPRIATQQVDLGNGSMEYAINIGSNYYEFDSTTTMVFNRLSLHPYLKYQGKPDRQITLKIDKQDFPADDLFASLPPGLFQNLDGLKTKGDLSFHLLFDVDLNNPDSLRFECDLKRKNFNIISYGKTNFTYINEPFEYTAYEKGEPVRTFMVGPENPNFRSLEQISPYLRNAVLNSEDGAFFGHRGFLPESFRESIVTNIKEKRFARGGSTITMQLVKNVFLNRNKTIARKLEEAIIVWLIENMQLSSKERMYDIYLNIIEWGPLVYGAQEASKFYFNKDASRLSLAEAIYLASIIPRPKFFRYTFDKNTGGLRDYIINYYQRMADKMLKKSMITQEDYDKLKPEIELRGPAKLLLQQPDSLMQADSLMLLREEYLK